MKTILEEARKLPVFAETEVLVAGGGLAGFAAALAAARTGAQTILLERNGCLGGVATASLMANIGNRFMVADGRQAVHGIAAEVVDRLAAVGGAISNWRKLKGICMDSERLKVVLIDMLEEARVTILTHSMACQPMVKESEVKGCFFESKSGRQAILSPNVVDCTGEADLAYRAGAETIENRASSTLLFKLAGVNLDRFVAFLGEDPDGFPCGMDWIKDYAEVARIWKEEGVFFFPHHGGKKWRWLQDHLVKKGLFGEFRTDRHGNRPWWKDIENIDAFGMYTHRRDGTLVINTGYGCFDHVEVGKLSQLELQFQQFAYYAADFMKKYIPGFENSSVAHIGVDLGLRGNRHILGRSKLLISEFVDNPKNFYRDDVIATAPINSTRIGERPGSFGTTCDIPFGSCVPTKIRRLLVGSGKSVDTEGGNYRIYRGMSGCMVYGQATGACAAVAAKKGVAAGDLPVRELQKELLRQGVRLGDSQHLQELGLEVEPGAEPPRRKGTRKKRG